MKKNSLYELANIFAVKYAVDSSDEEKAVELVKKVLADLGAEFILENRGKTALLVKDALKAADLGLSFHIIMSLIKDYGENESERIRREFRETGQY